MNSHLVLFFTRGVSLRTWDEIGMFEREVALYRRLRPHLSAVTFVTYGDMRDARYADRLDGIRVICNRLRLPGRRWFLPQRLYVPFLCGLSPILFRGRTVIKSNQVRGADVALRAARLSGAKFIARCGYLPSDFAECEFGSDSREAHRARALEREVFPNADRVVVTTSTMRDRVVADYSLSAKRVLVIPNYVCTDIFRPTSVDQHGKTVCFVGRLSEQKNVMAVLNSVRGLDVELVIVGDGPLRERLQAKATADGSSVHFLGNVPHMQLPKILNRAALFVLPSHYEGHPKTLLEAMACGLPVVGTDVPGIRELICHGQTGYLCGTSSQEIRAAIQEVLSDPSLRARMGCNARRFVAEHFALERVVEMELALLGELLG